MFAKCFFAILAAAPSLTLASAPDASGDLGEEYAKPHHMVDIGGRRLNLYCAGEGEQVVLFDSGGSDWSSTWALVHPAVAKRTRACVYDRAGLGYSDPARGPRTPIAIVDDLHKLVSTAGLKKPVVVGHSLGGFNAKLYAALYPDDVAALVLIDPAEERVAERTRAETTRRYGSAMTARIELQDRTFLSFLYDRYRKCLAISEGGDLDPKSEAYKRCSDPVRPALGADIAAERQRLQVKPAYQNAQASEILNSVFFDTEAQSAYAMLFKPKVFGSKPMVVLTHGLHDEADPVEVASQAQSIALHKETSGLSSRGRQRVVAGASHNIQVDAPSAIVEAVFEVLDALAPSSR